MEFVLSICIGISLSAACGFRIFVPLMVMSIASLSGHLTLSSGFVWIGTYPALICFAVATIAEICAYYIPWLDNLLDLIATPSAIVAGIIVTASCVTTMSPFLRWTLAIIAGGGIAGMVQALTTLVRGASTATTGGAANPVVSTAEAGGSLVLSSLGIVFPVIAALFVMSAIIFTIKKLHKKFTRKKTRLAHP